MDQGVESRARDYECILEAKIISIESIDLIETLYLDADTRPYILLCWSVRSSVSQLYFLIARSFHITAPAHPSVTHLPSILTFFRRG